MPIPTHSHLITSASTKFTPASTSSHPLTLLTQTHTRFHRFTSSQPTQATSTSSQSLNLLTSTQPAHTCLTCSHLLTPPSAGSHLLNLLTPIRTCSHSHAHTCFYWFTPTLPAHTSSHPLTPAYKTQRRVSVSRSALVTSHRYPEVGCGRSIYTTANSRLHLRSDLFCPRGSSATTLGACLGSSRAAP